jgi:hypothetical protein
MRHIRVKVYLNKSKRTPGSGFGRRRECVVRCVFGGCDSERCALRPLQRGGGGKLPLNFVSRETGLLGIASISEPVDSRIRLGDRRVISRSDDHVFKISTGRDFSVAPVLTWFTAPRMVHRIITKAGFTYATGACNICWAHRAWERHWQSAPRWHARGSMRRRG